VLKHQLVIGVVAVGALLAGCSGGSGKTPTSTPSPAVPSTAPSLSPGATAERDALAAYRGMWDAFVAAGKVSDPDAPDVRKYASDQALRLIVNALYTNHEQKKVIRGDLKIDPKVTALSPSANPMTATISDCVNSEKWLVYKASGGLVDNVPGGKHSTTATVKQTDGVWKVSSFILKEAGTC
jgi:hypothetical protein